MLLVITGAGASYDSDRRRRQDGAELRVPLAQDLFAARFAALAAKHDAVQGIILRLRDSSPRIEETLEELRAEQGRLPHRRRQLMGAVYYLRDVVAGAQAEWLQGRQDRVTNYIELIERIEQWRAIRDERVALVTFNYDTMLELAVHAVVGQDFRTADDYVGDRHYSVFKLHGSINWWTTIQDQWGGAGVRSPAAWAELVLGLDGHPTVTPGGLHVGEADGQTVPPVVPALSLPIVTKTDEEFACPSGHIELLHNILPSSRKVLIVGWRGAEAHFYSLWKRSFRTGDLGPNQVLVVDKDEGVSVIAANLRESAHWLGEPVVYGAGFSELLQSPELGDFLEAD